MQCRPRLTAQYSLSKGLICSIDNGRYHSLPLPRLSIINLGRAAFGYLRYGIPARFHLEMFTR